VLLTVFIIGVLLRVRAALFGCIRHFGGAWRRWPTVAFTRSNLLGLGSCNPRLGKFDKVRVAGESGLSDLFDAGPLAGFFQGREMGPAPR
jgi:hypothetical protein